VDYELPQRLDRPIGAWYIVISVSRYAGTTICGTMNAKVHCAISPRVASIANAICDKLYSKACCIQVLVTLNATFLLALTYYQNHGVLDIMHSAMDEHLALCIVYIHLSCRGGNLHECALYVCRLYHERLRKALGLDPP
jgi:hypothetical protein